MPMLCAELLYNYIVHFQHLLCSNCIIYADKPPLEVLYQFLDTQMPRQWAPVFGEHPLSLVKRHQTDACLQFSFLGPKLYVNNSVVIIIQTSFLYLLVLLDIYIVLISFGRKGCDGVVQNLLFVVWGLFKLS